MVQVDGCRLGVRSSSLEADRLLRHLLSPWLVAGDRRRPSYSIWIASQTDERRRPLHLLYRHAELVARSRHAGLLISRLIAHLASHFDLGRLIALRMVAMVRGSGAVLVPEELRAGLVERESRLNRHGLHLVDAPAAAVDPVSGDLVVSDPARLADLLAVRDAGPPLADGLAGGHLHPRPGRYRVTAWGFPDQDGNGQLSPADALALALQRVHALPTGGAGRALAALATISEGARAFSVVGPQDPVTALMEALETAPPSL